MKMLLFQSLLTLLALNSIDGYAQKLNIGALFGAQDEFAWLPDVFKFTIMAINNHNDGWYDDLLKDTVIDYKIADPNCDDQSSIHAFYDIKRAWNESIDAIIGPRRSGGAVASGWITTEEQIVQVAPTASAIELSDKDKFPFMTQLVAPGDKRGEVGAMVAMLEGFGWSRVSILYMDSEYATNYVNEFSNLWENRSKVIVSSQLIQLNGGNNCKDSVDEISAITALNKIPTNNPSINSRVVLLVAYNEEAYTVLKIAQEKLFQNDTIWVGPAAWIGRKIISDSNFEMPQIPGYIGLTPYRNISPTYYDFWKAFQEWRGNKVTETELPDFASEYLVDSIIAVLLAFNVTSPQDWKNASKITEALETQSFNGLSGLVELKDGYRTNPKYSIVILNVTDGNPEWKQIGTVGTNISSFKVDASKYICFAGSGCTTGNDFPSDRYPDPYTFAKESVAASAIAAVALLVASYFWYKNCRSGQKMRDIQTKMETLQKLNDELSQLDEKGNVDADRKEFLLKKRSLLLEEPPDAWSDSEKTLVEIQPHDEEYWYVSNELKGSMGDAHISKLWRVQNISHWTHYSFHKIRFSINGIDYNERAVWHGTSDVDPAVIYDDKQDGFMIQCSRSGSWGRGLYFAAESKYCHKFAFNPKDGLRKDMQSWSERPESLDGEKELFLTKLLIGNEIPMAKCPTLRAPPMDPISRKKYNTVTGETSYKASNGETSRSQVWVVYENGRAYPEYLVRYYRGEQDLERTPFVTQKDAGTSVNADSDMPLDVECGEQDTRFIWEFQGNYGWEPFDENNQSKLESAFQRFDDPLNSNCRDFQISSGRWVYKIDFETMKQVNINHSSHRMRDIRRREVDVEIPIHLNR